MNRPDPDDLSKASGNGWSTRARAVARVASHRPEWPATISALERSPAVATAPIPQQKPRSQHKTEFPSGTGARPSSPRSTHPLTPAPRENAPARATLTRSLTSAFRPGRLSRPGLRPYRRRELRSGSAGIVRGLILTGGVSTSSQLLQASPTRKTNLTALLIHKYWQVTSHPLSQVLRLDPPLPSVWKYPSPLIFCHIINYYLERKPSLTLSSRKVSATCRASSREIMSSPYQ
jgi:hypothetical protein